MKRILAMMLALTMLFLTGCSMERRESAVEIHEDHAHTAEMEMPQEELKVSVTGSTFQFQKPDFLKKAEKGLDSTDNAKKNNDGALEVPDFLKKAGVICDKCGSVLSKCETCDGSGKCGDCDVYGKHFCTHGKSCSKCKTSTCSDCDGTGYTEKTAKCSSCEGSGKCSKCQNSSNTSQNNLFFSNTSKNNLFFKFSCAECGNSEACDDCDGKGTVKTAKQKCTVCGGDGSYKYSSCPDKGECDDCDGAGLTCEPCKETEQKSDDKIIEKPQKNNCSNCGGSGRIRCYNCHLGTCQWCAGSGREYRYQNGRYTMDKCLACNWGKCWQCSGTGYKDCPNC